MDYISNGNGNALTEGKKVWTKVNVEFFPLKLDLRYNFSSYKYDKKVFVSFLVLGYLL